MTRGVDIYIYIYSLPAMPPPCSIDCLSDEEVAEPPEKARRVEALPNSAAGVETPRPHTPPLPKRLPAKAALTAVQTRGLLARLVCQNCPCQRGRISVFGARCLKQYRTRVEELFQLRVRLHRLSKRDMDVEASVC